MRIEQDVVMLELNVDSGEVIWNGKTIARLGSSETLVLSFLIENSGMLVSKDELLDFGWPDRFVTQNSLSTAIKKIRKLLLQTSPNLSIETVHRKGYIFHKQTISCALIGTRTELPIIDASPRKEAQQEVIEPNSTFEPSPHTESLSHHHSLCMSTLFYFLITLFFALSFFTYINKGDLFCYQINNAKVCGIFELDKADMTVINNEVQYKSGDYVYGYEKDISLIKVYEIY